MLEGVRLETVHPAFVHFTIGMLPIMVVAYGIAWWRRSDRWTVAGDVALTVGTVLTLVTVIFGLVSNSVVAWPGGLQVWRWVHLVFGALATLLLVGFTVARFTVRRAEAVSRGTAFAASLVISAVVGFGAWVGGEVLVFHSGIAVMAAGNGALAPPITAGDERPSSIEDAMENLRPYWASATTQLSHMIVEQPAAGGFELVQRDAERLQILADWIATAGVAAHLEENGQAGAGRSPPSMAAGLGGAVAQHEHEAQAGVAHAAVLETMARQLEKHASELAAFAVQRELRPATASAGQIAATCAGCHEQLRW